ncbi:MULTISPECIES: Flp family type IVb pilin [Desulfobacula]|uniref:Flp pilus assembly protein, pilin Flp n=1 Tax=Desulfobacula phenolica TaxID=90732 RepID=A0A1H2ERG9_9BACT|nr:MULTISPECIES: Flp family type IVb pilin [Desulfobacula]SDT97736.1 Flp pilus assembly protein, pilin Flp [Desulfobacula phenolica]
MQKIISFLFNEEGSTAVEYAILASAIAAVIVLAVTAIGVNTDNLFNKVKNNW